ncbi:hypothetical protein [Streptomyces sp. KR55]|uniref:hypothetical protein n=1 Tax=Streptomyces sp. KR55 TaxID=3457425 RepID=UPI003FCFA8C7
MQRLLMVAGSTALAAGGVLLPTSAFAAPATPPAGIMTTMVAEQDDHGQTDAAEWVKTTDSPSGITFSLPGQAAVEEIAEDANYYAGRSYSVTTADESTLVSVNEAPGMSEDLDGLLQSDLQLDSADPSDDLKATDIQKTTVDGHPAIDARVTDPADASTVGFIRLISNDTHVVKVLTIDSAADEKNVNQTHQKVRNSVSIPGPSSRAS